MTLRSKFILFTALASTLFSVAIVYDRVSAAREYMLARAQDRAEYTCAVIGELVGERLARGDRSKLKEILQSFAHFKQIAYLHVFDAGGKVIYRQAAPGINLAGRKPDPDVYSASDDIFDITREITLDGERLGTMEAGFSLEAIKESSENLMWRGIAISLLFISFITAVVWLLTVRLGRELDLLLDLAGKVDSADMPESSGLKPGTDTARIAQSLQSLSARLRREEALRLEAEKQKEDFFEMTVHDLKQPVTALKAALDLLFSEDEVRAYSKEQVETLRKIAKASVGMLTTMITDVLNTAKLNDPSYQVVKDRVPLADVMRECESENSGSVTAAGRKWRFHLPPETGNAWILADRDIIKRVVGNLVLNAIQYTPEGGAIKLSLEFRGKDMAAISVSDEGEGIPDNFREEIFKKYSTMSKSSKNLGLGLAFCKMAADRHSATLDVRSEEGKGTQISFVIPVSRAAVPAGSPDKGAPNGFES